MDTDFVLNHHVEMVLEEEVVVVFLDVNHQEVVFIVFW
jgi:hypothetical protein